MQAGRRRRRSSSVLAPPPQVCVTLASQAPPPHSLHWSLGLKLPSGWLLTTPPHLWARPHRGQRSAAELDELRSCDRIESETQTESGLHSFIGEFFGTQLLVAHINTSVLLISNRSLLIISQTSNKILFTQRLY